MGYETRARSTFSVIFAVLGAVLAVGVFAASAQAATEGPFYKVAGTRLATGSTKVLTVKQKEKLTLSSFGIVMTCLNVKSLSGAKILGSSGANSASSEETLEFSGCTTSGNGTPCEMENRKFTTTALKGTLGYATGSRTGQLEMLLKPASGTVFGSIHFTGEGCSVSSMLLEGRTIVALRSGGHPVEVGVNEVQAKAGEFEFKPTNATKIWTESAGALSEVKSALTFDGISFFVNGVALQELEGLPEWGAFT
jgi:hypothetical protein